ncbi:hypothetical protein Scep_022676 [Stephania cephalantha]|uniref:Uncharacterized protein n=1 Tax=Stephania cephalantha TaxID=152367 RepID=A0AAP0F8I5_9MAGN
MNKGKSKAMNRFKPLSEPETHSEYLLTNIYLLLIIENHILNKPLDTQVGLIMPPGLNYLPSRPHTNIKFYESILVHTKSVQFEHFTRDNSEEISYLKFRIQKVLTPVEWCSLNSSIQHSPFMYQQMIIAKDKPAVTINYKDYMDAWRNVLFYQDPSSKHSWYLTFIKSIKLPLPTWFMTDWWTKFGPSTDIFPATVMQAYEKSNLSLLQFMHQYSIPWILRWQYATHDVTKNNLGSFTYLSQDIYSKWWDKFNCVFITKPTAPPTPLKLSEFPSLSSSFKDVVTKPNPQKESSSSINLRYCSGYS